MYMKYYKMIVDKLLKYDRSNLSFFGFALRINAENCPHYATISPDNKESTMD